MNHRPHATSALRWALLTVALATLPAHALFRVVGPDGKVTYTDRPESSSGSKVQSVNASGGGASTALLPFELRQAAQRYPVTLYSSAECTPCDAGRQLLRDRGIPYTEKTVSTIEDAEALQRIAGGRDLPVLTIGSQILRGLQRTDWASYLDAADYPKESKLPSTYQHPAATPLTERQAAKPAAKAQAPAQATEPAPVEAPPASRIRF
jgi:glutaredoxin